MMSLHWPEVFLLLPLPWLVWRFVPAQANREAALFFPALQVLQEAEQSVATSTLIRTTPQRWRWWCLWAIWLMLLLAAARPQWEGEPVGIPSSGRDLLLVVDISGSMEMQDMQIDGQPVQRIDAMKKVVSEFVQKRTGDRLGLVLFGTRAYLQTPLTFDRHTLVKQLQEAQLGFAGEKTSIGDALALSAKRLQDRQQQSRVMILLTDGANTAGDISPLQGAELAANLGIRIYTIGMGAEAMEVRGFLMRQVINPSQDLDEDALRAIADKTGGRYFRARSTDELQGIYAELDKLEPSLGDKEIIRPISEWFYWPLAVALLLSLFMAVQGLWQQWPRSTPEVI